MSVYEGGEYVPATKVSVGEHIAPGRGCNVALIVSTPHDIDVISLLNAEEARGLAGMLTRRAEQLDLLANLERDLG